MPVLGPSPFDDPLRVVASQRAISVALSAETVLARVTRRAAHLLRTPVGLVSLVDDVSEVFIAANGLPGGLTSGSVPRAQSLCMHLVAGGGPLLLEDLRVVSPLTDTTALDVVGLRSYLGVPLTSHGLVLGALCVADVVPRRWLPDDVALLEDLAAVVSDDLLLRTSLEDLAQARQADRRLADEQAALGRVAAAVASQEHPQRVMQVVAEEAAWLVGADRAFVVRFCPDGRLDVRAGAESELHEGGCLSALARLRHTGRAALVREGAVPCVAAPVVVGGSTWGAVVATGAADREPGLACLTRLGELVALSLSNDEERELLVEMTRTDPLTGAANRREFAERLAAELERAQRHAEPLTLAFLDVDHFKLLNDTHGHDTGDRVVRELVGRVGHQLRGGDLLARIGGDEFALLLPETGYAAAVVVVDRVRQSVEQTRLAGLPVTVSLGAAVLDGGEATPDELYRRADQALYAAKARGRNAVAVEQVR